MKSYTFEWNLSIILILVSTPLPYELSLRLTAPMITTLRAPAGDENVPNTAYGWSLSPMNNDRGIENHADV